MTDAFTSKETHGGRRLDAVAHLFLSDKDSGRFPSSPPELPADVDTGIEKIQSAEMSAPLYTIVCPDGYIPHGALLGSLLALGMSTAGIAAGYVETTTQLPHTFFLSGGYHNLNAVFWKEGPRLSQFLNMVARLSSTSDLMLLSMTFSKFLGCEGLMALTERCLIPVSVDPKHLLKVYGAIKRIANEWKAVKIDLVVMEDHRTDKATGAAVILEEMARQFLPCSVRFIGSIPVDVNTAAPDGCLSGSFFRDLPDRVTIAAGEITGNLIKSAGFRQEGTPC